MVNRQEAVGDIQLETGLSSLKPQRSAVIFMAGLGVLERKISSGGFDFGCSLEDYFYSR